MGVTSVEDRSRNGSQADFPVLLPMNRTGLLLRSKVIHLTFSLYKFGPLAGASNRRKSKKDRTSPTYAGASSRRTKAILGSSELWQAHRPSRRGANLPAMRVHPCNSPPPRLIERPEAAQVNVHAGIIPAWV
jgi:hypothetical protein